MKYILSIIDIWLLRCLFKAVGLFLMCCLLESCYAKYDNSYYKTMKENDNDEKYGEGYNYYLKYYNGQPSTSDESPNWYYDHSYRKNPNSTPGSYSYSSGYDKFNSKHSDPKMGDKRFVNNGSDSNVNDANDTNLDNGYYKVPLDQVYYDRGEEAVYIPVKKPRIIDTVADEPFM